MKMFIVNKIRKMQTGDINHICDSIYFQGCSVGCPYCFNKETWDKKNGIEMTEDKLISKLSRVKWVCLMGGEPAEQNIGDIKKLIDRLHKLNKKVVLFTSYVNAPKDIPNADHYHIDVKVWDRTPAVPHDKTSYGVVSIICDEKDYKLCFRNITDKPIYIKSPVGVAGYIDIGLKVRGYLTDIGCKQTYLNRKIMVDNYDIL